MGEQKRVRLRGARVGTNWEELDQKFQAVTCRLGTLRHGLGTSPARQPKALRQALEELQGALEELRAEGGG